MRDSINHPRHYNAHPSGVECITVTEHMGFNLGNAIKYIWRADLKGDAIQDLHKALWYVKREIERRVAAGPLVPRQTAVTPDATDLHRIVLKTDGGPLGARQLLGVRDFYVCVAVAFGLGWLAAEAIRWAFGG